MQLNSRCRFIARWEWLVLRTLRVPPSVRSLKSATRITLRQKDRLVVASPAWWAACLNRRSLALPLSVPTRQATVGRAANSCLVVVSKPSLLVMVTKYLNRQTATEWCFLPGKKTATPTT